MHDSFWHHPLVGVDSADKFRSVIFVARGKKGDPKEIEKLRQDIEDYKAKLKEEFGYQPHQQSWLSLVACFQL